MHMKFSTHMENTLGINTSFLSYPSKTYPYSLQTVSMETVPNFRHYVFSRRTRSNIVHINIYLETVEFKRL